MSSHCVSICLLVLLGALMTSGASFQYISDELQKKHNHVARVLSLTQRDLILDPLFSSVIQRNSSSCHGQRRDDVNLMSVALDVYANIFSNVLNQLEATGPKRDLQDLQAMMENVRQHLREMNHDRKKVMEHLKSIKVDDVMVQRKALAEFKEVYQAASLMINCGHAPSSSSD